jgi:hypothetical protein
MAPSNSGITDKHRWRWLPAAGGIYHLLYRMRLSNIGFEESPGPPGCHYSRKGTLRRSLVSMVMDANRPAGEGKSHADGSANAPGCAGHKHCLFLVDLVHLVYLVCLIHLVCLVYLVEPD